MTGHRNIWIRFGAAAFAVTAAMVGLSVLTLTLERKAEHSRRQQAHEEKLKEALWRLDAFVVPILGQQAALAYSHYVPAFIPPKLYTSAGTETEQGAALMEISPVLMIAWPQWVRLHFQAPVSGGIASPQVPEGDYGWVARAAGLKANRIAERKALLRALGKWLTPDTRIALARKGTDQPLVAALAHREKTSRVDFKWKRTVVKRPVKIASRAPVPKVSKRQQRLGINTRRRYFQRAQVQRNPLEPAANALMNMYRPPAQRKKTYKTVVKKKRIKVVQVSTRLVEVQTSPVTAAWIPAGGPRRQELVLYRVATLDGKKYIQGALVDWPALQKELTKELGGLFQHVELVPMPSATPGSSYTENRMTTLPVVLKTGAPLAAALPWTRMTPVRTALLIAWILALAALVATGAAVRSVNELGRRRVNFVSAVSHELRTPLTAFRMYLDMLADNMIPSEEKRAETLSRLQGQAERLSGLVRGVLDFSRLERQSFAAHKKEMPAQKLFNDLHQAASDRCKSASADLAAASEIPANLTLETDPEAVTQVVLNLVDNACKYGGEPDTPARIRMEARTHKSDLVLAVSDNGPGIPPLARKKLFQPFYRAEDEMTREHPGVGLGMAIALGLARACGASLKLTGSTLDSGNTEARFELRIPLKT